MKTIKNIFKIIISNLSTIIAGILVSFFLPKIISVEDYGFYKVFSLYFNYLGVLSLGIIDGIVLKYGNKNYDELKREKFRAVFWFYSLMHVCFVAVLIILSFFFTSADYKFIILMLAAILIPTNITGYFQQISQITQRFKEYSLRKILQSLCNIIFVGVLVLLFYLEIATINYHIYVIGVASISVLLAAWYIFTYRAIVFGRGITLRECWTEIIELVKLGFPLLVANLCSTLLLSLDRQFVSLLFTTEEYATYAFAYSMLSLITVATSSISTVIYPLFKRLDQEKLKNNFRIISAIVFIVVFCICLIYNPLVYFINWFLPKYSESLVIFRIILPGVALSAAITVVLHTYYKVLGHSFKYFVISLIALLISASFNVVAYLIFKTRESISIASIVSLLIWYIITSFSINKECKFSIKNAIYILLMFVSFYCSTILTIPWASFLIQITSFSVITFFYVRKDYKEIKALLFGQKKKNDTTEPSTQDVSY